MIVKDGREYLDVKGVKLDLKVGKLSIVFQNSDNNKEINDVVNKVINENWKEIFYELKPDLEKNTGDVILSLVKPMFAEIPYSEFYLPEN